MNKATSQVEISNRFTFSDFDLVPRVTPVTAKSWCHDGLAIARSVAERHTGGSAPKHDYSRHFFWKPAFTIELWSLRKTFGLTSHTPPSHSKMTWFPNKQIQLFRFSWSKIQISRRPLQIPSYIRTVLLFQAHPDPLGQRVLVCKLVCGFLLLWELALGVVAQASWACREKNSKNAFSPPKPLQTTFDSTCAILKCDRYSMTSLRILLNIYV